ncbi:EAL domain-containing protein [Kordiimonas marina]|uniref:EAL domain-containing protein n=1 Tax=Kordiimonas marina TaxID=2872312 RepID=UPI001FF6A145|nr:EAL domain-containing protein [Kordiimonas marina]MCJ9427707.1 EAL domain-containing protein [Kordiimonas marina]
MLELDTDFFIQNADGAVKNTLGIDTSGAEPINFLDLLTDRGRSLIESAAKTLTGANRLGPFTVSIGRQGGTKEQFAIFMAKLPTATDRIYVVLSRPYRLGVSGKSETSQKKTDEKKQEFYERLEALFEGNPEAQDQMLVTVLEAGAGQALSGEQRQEIEKYLRTYSVGGNHAAQLADDKFAFVHEKPGPEGAVADFAGELEKVTGLSVQAATIDAAEATLSQKDSLRALVFSLQNFARENEGFGVGEIATNCRTMIGETTERVKAFRQVLEDGAFSLVFQPIVHLKRGTVHHFEALTRFELPPMIKTQWEMIRFAEDVGLIDDFDYAVVGRAISKIRELLRKGGAPGIAVNLSGRSLSNPEFLLELMSVLRGNEDLKRYLSLEITESAKIHDLDALGHVLEDIREIGFKVYLDDFGAGAAGFQYLKKLKVDALKIDGAYIRNALEDREDRAFLRSMVTLCKDLGIVTVGEWVETRAHAELLTGMGVDYGQGYFFGKPSANFLVKKSDEG